MNRPNLIEPGVSHWLNNILKKSNKFRNNHRNFIFNFTMSVIFILLVSGYLGYKYKGNITQEEINIKNNIKKTYIMSKLQKLAAIKKTKNTSLITDLPTFDSPEIDILNSKSV